MFKYTDTVDASVDRLKEARKNINWGCTVSSFMFLFCYLIGVVALLKSVALGLFFVVIASFFIIMSGNLMVKREIFSMMIFLKERDEK